MTIAFILSNETADIRSHRISQYFKNHISETNFIGIDILNLNKYRFQFFDEQLDPIGDSSTHELSLAETIKDVDGVLIVTSEFNEGYPESLRNAINYLNKEWKQDTEVSLSTSNRQYKGMRLIRATIFSLWNIGVCLMPALQIGTRVQNIYPFGRPSYTMRSEIEKLHHI